MFMVGDKSKARTSPAPAEGERKALTGCPLRSGLAAWALPTVRLMCLSLALSMNGAMAQGPVDSGGPLSAQSSPVERDVSPAPAKVDVRPVARDDDIRDRIKRILDATEWFTEPEVRVEQGVVFLSGKAKSAELKKWAGDLARNTQDVAAVANRMEVVQASVWDARAAWGGVAGLWGDIIRALPMMALGLIILIVSTVVAWLAMRGARGFLADRVGSRLLRGLVSRGAGVVVLLVGVYIVLRIAGLTQLALTIVGGTGLLGLALGFAFRDIAENYLASIFLSIQRPFDPGDLVEIAGVTGYVRQMNVRTTVLVTLSGSISQLPNATVYKSIIRNFTTNPNRREDFVVGIGYDDPIDRAQEVARKVLSDHPAVLQDPEPWVLVDELGKATVNLRVYFWLDGQQHSWLKVRSSVIRLVKRAFQDQGISMPDEAREVVFPRGVPVTMIGAEPTTAEGAEPMARPFTPSPAHTGADVVSTRAEGGLSSEAETLKEQARRSEPPDEKENLLSVKPGATPSP